MKKETLSRLLAILALCAIVIYAINCRPSWNPDGTEVAWCYTMDEEAGIAIYNAKSQRSRNLVRVTEKSGDLMPIEVFWLKNGRELMYVGVPTEEDKDKKPAVYKYDLRAGDKKLVAEFAVSDAEFKDATLVRPIFLEKEKRLWIADKDGNYWQVNAGNGKMKRFRGDDKAWIIDADKKVFYARQSGENELTYGRISKCLLFFSRDKDLFTLHWSDEMSLLPLFSTPAKKDLFAFIKSTLDHSTLEVLNHKGKTLHSLILPDEIIIPDMKDDPPPYCSAWDALGERLWFVASLQKAGDDQFGVVEVNLTTGAARFINVSERLETEKDITFLDMSLSPDESRLAFPVMHDEKFALVIIEIRENERIVEITTPPIEKK